MRAECLQLVEDMNPAEHNTIFSSETDSYRDKYFINSADKIGYFFEEGALDKDGQLKVPKHESLNKIGHALHVLCPSFRQFTFDDRIKNILRNLGHKDPVVMQSMYIFKPPRIGGIVNPHQDACYLYTKPLKHLVGLWLALEDATLENSCMWFVPGSHKTHGLVNGYQMIRNPEKNGPSCIFTADKPTYEGDYVPVPVKKGTLVLIDGLVFHKSDPNTSDKSRHIYTFHSYDAGETEWSDQNWLQPTDANTFTHVYDVKL